MIVPISAVVTRLKTIVSGIAVDKVWIQGEISNLTKHPSGIYYFSIKDEEAELSCVMFASYVSRLKFSLEEGMKVLVKGSLNLYVKRGSLQLYVKFMKQDGLGDLYLEFEQRKKRLYDQGYFDERHKKPKPENIESIAIITAKEGAALQDALKTIQKRWPMMKVTLFPSYVQGNLAPASLIKQLIKADTKGFDAILLIRGGGSFEDLFCFNDEDLVKTIYSCKTYIVSGVGHEVDTTLCDLVSDHRAVTPTAAAQWITLDQREVLNQIHQNQEQLKYSMKHIFDLNSSRFTSIISNPYIQDPKSWILEKHLRLDHATSQILNQKDTILSKQTQIDSIKKELNTSLHTYIQNAYFTVQNKNTSLMHAMNVYKINQTKHLKENESLLDAYSPLKVLTRGYSITSSENTVIRSIHDVNESAVLHTRFQDGVILSKVIGKENIDGSKENEISRSDETLG